MSTLYSLFMPESGGKANSLFPGKVLVRSFLILKAIRSFSSSINLCKMFLLYWLLECYTLQMSFQISPLKASHSTFSRPLIRLCLILLWDRCSSYRPRSLTTPSSVYTLLILCIRMVIHSSCVKHPLSIL